MKQGSGYAIADGGALPVREKHMVHAIPCLGKERCPWRSDGQCCSVRRIYVYSDEL